MGVGGRLLESQAFFLKGFCMELLTDGFTGAAPWKVPEVELTYLASGKDWKGTCLPEEVLAEVTVPLLSPPPPACVGKHQIWVSLNLVNTVPYEELVLAYGNISKNISKVHKPQIINIWPWHALSCLPSIFKPRISSTWPQFASYPLPGISKSTTSGTYLQITL